MPGIPTIDFAMVFQWLEHVLSFAGLVALGSLFFNWFSKFTTKQKELSDLDKEARSLLKEEIDAHKNLRELDKELFSKHSDQMQREYQELSKRFTNQTTRSQLVDIVAGIVLERANADLVTYLRIILLTLYENTAILSEQVGIDDSHGFQIFSAGLKSRPVPEEPIRKAIYNLGVVANYWLALASTLHISSSIMPTVLQEFEKNPQQPLQQSYLIALHRVTVTEGETFVLDLMKRII